LTRLKHDDIRSIATALEDYDRALRSKTGRTLRGIACRCCNISESLFIRRASSFTLSVVPVTAGAGIITSFSDTLCAILRHLGFSAKVTGQTDTAGLAEALENQADGIFMADDNRFIAFNTLTRAVADNSEATGRVFATALDLMTEGGSREKDVLVLGCGPVGRAAALKLLELGARVSLFDIAPEKAWLLRDSSGEKSKIQIMQSIDEALGSHRLIVDATPTAGSIPDSYLTDTTIVSAPGVPLGLSSDAAKRLGARLIHDKLELGVAAMAASLLANLPSTGDHIE